MHYKLILAALAAAQLALTTPVPAPEAMESREEGIYDVGSVRYPW